MSKEKKSLLNEHKTLKFQLVEEYFKSSHNGEEIKELNIEIDYYSDISLFSQFSNLSNLTIVMSPVSRQIPDLSPVSECKNIKSLTIYIQNHFFNHRERLESFDISWVSKIEGLESLDFAVFTKSVDLSPLGKCKNLRKITVRNTLLDEIDLEPISTCSILEEITLLWNLNATNIVLPTLGGHQNMRQIYIQHRLYGCGMPSFEHRFREIQPIDLKKIAGCHSLKTLVLRGLKNMGSIDLTPISRLKALEYLNISNATPASETLDLSPLGKCKNLKYLILEDIARSVLDITPLFECGLQAFIPFHPPEHERESWHPLLTAEEIKESYWTTSAIRLKELFPDTLEELGLLNSYRPLSADSSVISVENRNPRWLKPFKVDWY